MGCKTKRFKIVTSCNINGYVSYGASGSISWHVLCFTDMCRSDEVRPSGILYRVAPRDAEIVRIWIADGAKANADGNGRFHAGVRPAGPAGWVPAEGLTLLRIMSPSPPGPGQKTFRVVLPFAPCEYKE